MATSIKRLVSDFLLENDDQKMQLQCLFGCNGLSVEHSSKCQAIAFTNDNTFACKRNNNNFFKVKRKSGIFSFSTSRVIVLLAIGLVLWLESVDCHREELLTFNYPYSHPTREFSSHVTITPQLYHGRTKRALTANTLEESGLHATHLTFTYNHKGATVTIDLQRNDDLIPSGHFMRYQQGAGHVVQNFTDPIEVDLCHYQGTVRGVADSMVALSTCRGVSGVIYDGSETYHIYSEGNQLNDTHYMFSHADKISPATCGYVGGINATHDPDLHQQMHSTGQHSEFNRILRYKRSTPSETTIRGPYNANQQSSFVELVLVVDNKVYKTLGSSLKNVHNHCKEIANIINALYVPLNIFIALVGIVVWNDVNEVDLSSDGDKTLKNFLHYRRKVLVKDHPNDNAQLLTKEQFAGGVVGKALKGPICTYEYSGGVSMDHSQVISVVATTVAHEMGHNFGMEHDTEACVCKDHRCIMSSSSSAVSPKHWSSCSIDQLNLAFHHGMNYCLRNRPQKLFESPLCGNGFVEPGEQCDCGLAEFCENSCCDPNTCMLNANATCATGQCCDFETCRPKVAGTQCRSADGECDLPEFCTGESEYCPADVFRRDTESCDGGEAFCYNGSCRSRTDQCKILWGPSGKSSEQCYDKNTEGSRHGNCGYNRLMDQYMRCKKEDIHCGMLHCRHLNERLEFGMESLAVLSHSFMNYKGSIIPCRTAMVDLGLQSIDPGLTPDGAKCGDGMMCVNQRCMAVGDLRTAGRSPECPDDCSGHGTCNSLGHCHCDKGFAPPLCNAPGPGGSQDSGPASNPDAGAAFTRVLYIFFLGVVPLTSIALIIVYYIRQNRPLILRKKKPVSPSKSLTSPSSRGPPSSPHSITASTPSSTDDMNSALLRTTSPTDTSHLNNNMFGQFKGFSLKPLSGVTGTPEPRKNFDAPNVAYVQPISKQSDPNPSRSAPPVPKPPYEGLMKSAPPHANPNRMSMFGMNSLKKKPMTIEQADQLRDAPALPPLNPGAHPRPLISSPILEASTCSAKELISPLKHSADKVSDKYPQPVRAAPEIPKVHDAATAPKVRFLPQQEEPTVEVKKPKESLGPIKRIASFLNGKRGNDESSASKPEMMTPMTAPPKPKKQLEREKLKNIDISSPIPQMEDGDEVESGTISPGSIQRTQSMRDPPTTVMSGVAKRPNLQSFGSMRHPSRPKSVVGTAQRPKSPPPPRPPTLSTTSSINSSDGYKIPKKISFVNNEYDDCEAVEVASPNGDNIYSVIDEFPSKHAPPVVKSVKTDSMGLLGEIVNEIENRNLDSIYSTSTLGRKTGSGKGKTDSISSAGGGAYVNANEIDTDDYSNVKSSAASTTSSGYLRPSAINNSAPIARIAPNNKVQTKEPTPTVAPTMSSFKPVATTKVSNDVTTTTDAARPYKPYNNFMQRPLSSNYKTPTNVSVKDDKKKTTDLGSSVRTRTPSPSAAKTNAKLATTTAVNSTTVKSVPKAASAAARRTNSSNTLKSGPDLVQSITANNTNAKQNNNSVKQPDVITNGHAGKPKPSVKPATIMAAADKNNKKSGMTSFRGSNKDDKSMGSNKIGTPDTKTSSNTTTSSKNILNAAARPTTAGKVSNVAALQQRFETPAVGGGGVKRK